MTRKTTSTTHTRRVREPAAIGLVTALALLLAVQGSMALSGDVLAANALSSAPLLSTLQHQAAAVISQAERLASNLRLAYEIQVLVTGEGGQAEATPTAGSEQVSCNLSATGLIRAWAD